MPTYLCTPRNTTAKWTNTLAPLLGASIWEIRIWNQENRVKRAEIILRLWHQVTIALCANLLWRKQHGVMEMVWQCAGPKPSSAVH